MIQCPDAHLFCSSCMTTYAETLLGSHDHKIICMDQSGCKLPFPVTELHRFLVIFYYCWISTAFDAPL
jgi:TRIAD3 protein (E3 ubiquitin-protein ligase RNF216)